MTEIDEPTRKLWKHVLALLRTGFTGEIVLICNQGGVRAIHRNEKITPKDLDGT